jgi:hypothetical protein
MMKEALKSASCLITITVCSDILLTACSSMSDANVEALLTDPSRYEFADCKQLEETRSSLVTRAGELNRLMAKAETGFAGSLVATIAYQDDLTRNRAEIKRVDDALGKQRCRSKANSAADPNSGGISKLY